MNQAQLGNRCPYSLDLARKRLLNG
jgi:hypothetical protein